MNRKREAISVHVGLELQEQEKRSHKCSCRIGAPGTGKEKP